MNQAILFNNATQAQIDETLTTLLAEGKPIVLALTAEGQSRNLDTTYSYYILLNQGSYFQGFMSDGEIYLAPGEGLQYVYSDDASMA